MTVLLMLLAVATAAFQRPSDVVRWSVHDAAAAVGQNRVAKIVFTARIEPGWKLYAIEQPKDGPKPLTFETPSPHFQVLPRQIVAPKPKTQKDENFGLETRYYEKEAVFEVPVSVSASAKTGRQSVPVSVTFQACGADICLRPFTQKLEAQVDVR